MGCGSYYDACEEGETDWGKCCKCMTTSTPGQVEPVKELTATGSISRPKPGTGTVKPRTSPEGFTGDGFTGDSFADPLLPQEDFLFKDIGFPDDTLGMPTYQDINPRCLCDIIIDNDAYEEDVEVWFTKKPTPKPPIPGCTDPLARNYNPQATVDDATCTYHVQGCIDPAATNYNPLATVDNGSCVYPPTPILGCRDPVATNYNPLATIDDGSCVYPPSSGPTLYTGVYSLYPTNPKQMMETTIPLSKSSPGAPGQDPDSVTWLTPTQWASVSWDGVPLDTTGLTRQQLCTWLGPSPYLVKGLRQRFYEVNPFTDNDNPTVAEINDWNLEVIRHFRKLFGNSSPVDHDARLYLEALWADERKYSTVWDTAYPVGMVYQTNPEVLSYTGGTHVGPCVGYTDVAVGHCGAGFFPSTADRAPYISASYNNDYITHPELNGYNARFSGTEGMAALNPLGVPWSMKLAFIIRNWICNEGLTQHAGPYVGDRRWFGCNWWYTGGNLNYRGKWR